MDLASQYQRRFAPSVFLPPMAPRLASSSGFSAFSNYQSLPTTLAPAAAPDRILLGLSRSRRSSPWTL
ncbi:unnamed protein product [Miscanthus lutarioriparius]|uniref:Uncharacterized protein n=1 Tax=Miscanthus lutarioriparius TaxID=422564 RepID=A0A811NHQ5_9POAL|nr:unnamed protein product [Miscanthus lutarioriparius]